MNKRNRTDEEWNPKIPERMSVGPRVADWRFPAKRGDEDMVLNKERYQEMGITRSRPRKMKGNANRL